MSSTDGPQLIEMPPFSSWLASNIPAVYDNTMSYYEELCALIAYLENQVTPAVNANTVGLEELKKYVEDYFKNLDVQEEINNKLDQMAESGELETIINQYLQSNVAWMFDTVADMQESTNLIEGSYARTLGYSTIGDGLGGLYKIVTTSTGNIALDNGLYAHLCKENAVVSIDDYEGATAEDRLHAALDDLASGIINGGKITITKQYNAGNKDYRQITISNCIFDVQYDKWFDQNATVYHSVPSFANCTFNGNGNTIFVGDFDCVGPDFSNCILNNITVYNSSSHYIQSPYFINCQMYALHNLFTSYGAYDFKMIGCRVESATGTLVTITSQYGLRQGSIQSSLIEGRSDVVFSITSCFQFTIDNCYFESCQNGILDQTELNGAAYVIITNNIFYKPMETATYAIRLASGAYQRAIIRDNITDFPEGKLLCDRNIKPTTSLGWHNFNYLGNYTSFANDGFEGQGTNKAYEKIRYGAVDATWDSSDSTWICEFYLPYGEAYTVVSPYLLCFVGSFTGSPNYRGYANILVTPRVGYDGSVKLMVDATILQANNHYQATPAAHSVTATASLSSTGVSTAKVKVTVKIGGFSSNSGRYSAVDMLTLMGFDHKFMA